MYVSTLVAQQFARFDLRAIISIFMFFYIMHDIHIVLHEWAKGSRFSLLHGQLGHNTIVHIMSRNTVYVL